MLQELYARHAAPPASAALRDQIGALRERGEESSIVGWKVALNSPAVQRHLGLPGPLLDFLTRETIAPDNEPIGLEPDRRYLAEVEIYLILASDVSSDPSAEECGDSIGCAGVAVEILDVSAGPKDLDWILRNHTYHYAAVLGPSISASAMPAVAELALLLSVGTSASLELDPSLLLGELPEVVGFSARLAGATGRCLREGDAILCGSLNPPAPVKAGQSIAARLQPVGELHLRTVRRTFGGAARIRG